MQRSLSAAIILLVIVLIGVAAAAGWRVLNQENSDDSYHNLDLSQITSYEDCVAAGFPIMESYPEQCTVPAGRTFTRTLSEEEQDDTLSPADPADIDARNDAARTITFANNYAANNNGRYPALEDFPADIEVYNLPDVQFVSTSPEAGEIQYQQQAECVNGILQGSGSVRQVAVQVLLSDGTLYCTDNS